MTKAELRKIYLAKRAALTELELQDLNERITSQFFATIDLSNVRVLHTFVPIEKTREPDTWLIINRIPKEYPHIQISVPKINNQTAMMDNFYLEYPEQLEKNTWGIPEPKEGIATPTEKIDVIIVPLLAFDRRGHRVGYGRGFYDKFLATAAPQTRKIGLSFFPPTEKIEDIQKTDEKLTHAITPGGLLLFNQT
jgi:5-formyltetrahydrofolate cyclo-ligase